jgi:hypothetical protein
VAISVEVSVEEEEDEVSVIIRKISIKVLQQFTD